MDPGPSTHETTSNGRPFELGAATLALLQRVGAVDSATPGADIAPSFQNKDVFATTTWQPLVPIDDFVTLLGALSPSAVPPALQGQVAPLEPHSAQSRSRIIDTVARLALEPSLTTTIASLFEPVSVQLWGRWLDLLGLLPDGEWSSESSRPSSPAPGEQQAVERVYTAMIRVLPVFHSVFP